jgi:hypothetical protein
MMEIHGTVLPLPHMSLRHSAELIKDSDNFMIEIQTRNTDCIYS